MPVDFHRPILLALESPSLLRQQPIVDVEEEDGTTEQGRLNAAFHWKFFLKLEFQTE